LNQCGFNLFVRKRDREKAKLKEDVPVHGCKIQGRYTCAWLQCFNAGKASGPKCEVKSRVHLITHLDMVTQSPDSNLALVEPNEAGTSLWHCLQTVAPGCAVYCLPVFYNLIRSPSNMPKLSIYAVEALEL